MKNTLELSLICLAVGLPLPYRPEREPGWAWTHTLLTCLSCVWLMAAMLLHTMEHEGYVKAYTQLTPNGRERKYYHLTKDGEAYLALKTEQWRLFSSKVDAVIGAPRCTV